MGLCPSKEGDKPSSKRDIYLPSSELATNSPYGPLSAKQYKRRQQSSGSTQTLHLPYSGYNITYAYVSQRGYYPDTLDKPSQDSLCVHTYFNGDPDQMFIGVFDGHGETGTSCSQFAKDKVSRRS